MSTTGERSWNSIFIYDATGGLSNYPPPLLQNITGLRAVHGMVWDDEDKMLWAAGTDAAPDGSDHVPANATLQAYPFDTASNLFAVDKVETYKLPYPADLQDEWGQGYPWWSGPHDLTGIPNQRKLLMTTDRDLHVFDLTARQFQESGADVVHTYLPGFLPVDNDHGGLPMSDVKSVSLAPDGSFAYVQSLWKDVLGNGTNLVADQKRDALLPDRKTYRSRFFEDIPGWPKP